MKQILLHSNLDANESAIFGRELEHVKSRTADIKYPELKIANGLIIPISREAGDADETISYKSFDQAGVAKIISNYADDLPAADVAGTEHVSTIKSIGSSFSYNIQEVRAAAKTGRSLPQARATAARRAIMQKIESIGFSGDTASGLKGLINHPNIQEYTVSADGNENGGINSTRFAHKTAEQILRDLNGIATQVSTITKGVESPDTLLLDLSNWNLLTTLRIPDTQISVLKWFLENSPHIKNVDWLNQLTDADNNNEVAIMYRRDSSKLTLEIPKEYEQMTPQQINLAFKVPAHARIGGVIVYYPLSIIKAAGV
tara:strand:- start:2339 stop:3283 length:945 start_codon:yes stop_codon:yes gene_type:complete